jgi:5-methylcytosine-specific restriction endonuclease McrA
MNYFNSDKGRDRAPPENDCSFSGEREQENYLAFANSPQWQPVERKTKWQIYIEYMRSPAWKKKRQEALKRDNYKCRTCGAIEHGLYGTQDLEVHHRHYDNFTNESLETLTTLCKECHHAITSVHRGRKYGKRSAPKPMQIDEPQKRVVSKQQTRSTLKPVPIEENKRNNQEVKHDLAKIIRDTEKRSPNSTSQWSD